MYRLDTISRRDSVFAGPIKVANEEASLYQVSKRSIEGIRGEVSVVSFTHDAEAEILLGYLRRGCKVPENVGRVSCSMLTIEQFSESDWRMGGPVVYLSELDTTTIAPDTESIIEAGRNGSFSSAGTYLSPDDVATIDGSRMSRASQLRWNGSSGTAPAPDSNPQDSNVIRVDFTPVTPRPTEFIAVAGN